MSTLEARGAGFAPEVDRAEWPWRFESAYPVCVNAGEKINELRMGK